jgi:hypothetical protein
MIFDQESIVCTTQIVDMPTFIYSTYVAIPTIGGGPGNIVYMTGSTAANHPNLSASITQSQNIKIQGQ